MNSILKITIVCLATMVVVESAWTSNLIKEKLFFRNAKKLIKKKHFLYRTLSNLLKNEKKIKTELII